MLEIKSAETQVYEALRAEILGGHPPGAPLRLADLAERYGVSTMPIRAALRRLEADGLVRPAGQRGHVVAPLDLDDLVEVQTVRAALEGYAAFLGAQAVDAEDLAAMRALVDRLRSLPAATGIDAYLDLEHQFRDRCYDATRRARLLELLRTSRRAAERYIRIALGSTDGMRDSIGFQERLYDACAAHDGVAAEAATRDALRWTMDRIAPHLAPNR